MDDLSNNVATKNEGSKKIITTVSDGDENETLTCFITTVSGILGPKSTSVFAECNSFHKTLHSSDCPVADMANNPYRPPPINPTIPSLVTNSSPASDQTSLHGDRTPGSYSHIAKQPSVWSHHSPGSSHQATGNIFPSYSQPRHRQAETNKRSYNEIQDVEGHGKVLKQSFLGHHSLPAFPLQDHHHGLPPSGINRPYSNRRILPYPAVSELQSMIKKPPPMPPLLKIPHSITAQVSASVHSKSFPTSAPTHESLPTLPYLAPLHAQCPPKSSAIVDLLQNSKHYVPQVTNPYKVDTNSCSITPPGGPRNNIYPFELPGGSRSSVSYPFAIPENSREEPHVLSDNSSVSSGDWSKEGSNAAKCKEYRERSRAKKEQEMREFQQQLARNIKLKDSYDKKVDRIRKLKAFYLQCLQNKKFKCVDHNEAEIGACSQSSPESAISSASSTLSSSSLSTLAPESEKSVPVPMVTIKAEDADLITDIKTEVEDYMVGN